MTAFLVSVCAVFWLLAGVLMVISWQEGREGAAAVISGQIAMLCALGLMKRWDRWKVQGIVDLCTTTARENEADNVTRLPIARPS